MGSSSRCCTWWGCWGLCTCARDSRQHYKRGTRVWAPPNGVPELLEDGVGEGSRGWGIAWPKRRTRGGRMNSIIGNRTSVDGELPDIDAASIRPKKGAAYSIFAARLAIMIMITVLIGLLTILTWHFTTVYTTRSIKSLALGLRTEILQRPLGRMWNILNGTLDTTVTHVNLARSVVGRYSVPFVPVADEQLQSVMRNVSWAIFTSQQAVSTLSVVYIDGVSQSFERNPDTGSEFFVYSVPVNSSANARSPAAAPTAGNPLQNFPPYGSSSEFLWYRQRVDKVSGYDAGPPVSILPYNLSQEFSGVSLLEHVDVTWHATVQGSSDTPFLAAGSPVVHPLSGEVVAVAGVKRALSSVSQLMKEITSRYSGIMYLTNAEGWLLASSTSAPLLKRTSDGPSLIRAEESTDPVINVCAEWLREYYGSLVDKLQSVHEENVLLAGTKYYVDTFVLNLTKLPLVGVIVTPEAYVMGEVDRRGDTTVAILISISVCFLVVGCLFTLIFTTGVSSEMKLRSEVIDHLDARRKAEKSSNYKSQFLANMSHELRTPMAAVIGLLDILLSDEYMTSEQVAMVSQIRHCSTALLRLLNNILDLSKVESGKFVLEEADFDIRHELEGLVDMFSVQCPDQNIEIVLDLADDVPRFLRGDSARTVQIFANLIANSIKFTSSGHVLVQGGCETGSNGRSALLAGKSALLSGSGRLEVNNHWFSRTGSAQVDDAAKHPDMICLWFEVDDTGCGIDPRKWETVFDSFVQADPSTTRTYGGTGLGLCIVRSLVQSMGGEIKIAIKDDPGTLLKFYLYFKLPPEHVIPRTFKDYCTSTFFSQTLQHSRLLFALQGCTGRRTMGGWMRNSGLLVSEASTWEDTVAELEELLQNDTVPKLRPLAIIDISLILHGGCLDVLDKYTQRGVLIGWLLNHNTTCALKSNLRRRGFSIMANKPVYKSKLVQLLKMLVGCCKESGEVGSRGLVNVNLDSRRTSSHYDEDSWDGCKPSFRSMERAILNEVTQGHSVRISSLGMLGKVVEHSSCQELVPAEVRHHRSDDSPSYNPGRYLTPCLGEHNEGWKVDSALRTSEMEQNSAVSLMKSDSGKVLDGEMNPFRDGLAMESPRSQEGGVLIPDMQGNLEQENGEQIVLGVMSHQDKLQDKVIVDKVSKYEQVDDIRSDMRSSELQSLFGPSNTIHSSSAQVTTDIRHLSHGIYKPDPQLEVVGDVPLLVQQPTPPKKSRGTQHSSSSRFGPKDALRGVRILLAEDTPVLQRVATMMLEKLGASVVAVSDGLEAVNALTKTVDLELQGGRKREMKFKDPASRPFDLVLMDCQMPKMDGYDATRAIREAEEGSGCHIPIVALTAHAMSSDEAKCLKVGMDAYLTKPIDHKLMMSTITSFTRIREDLF